MAKKLAAEFLGTAMLLFVVVATGIMVSTIADDDITETVTSVGAALQLFIVGVSVAVGLAVIIMLFVTISGSHFNPVVTMVNMIDRSMDIGTGFSYIVVQFLGAAFGVIVGNLVFGLDPITISDTIRTGPVLRFSEMVATFLLLLVILGLVRTQRASAVPWAVGGIVLVIVLATSSTGFANPALTAARMLTDTYTGIDPSSVMPFITAQIVGALLALLLAAWLFPLDKSESV
jgi:glycerol uptake facilitator-like aquaporin